ncbi:hypothetical protein COS86_06035 [Candidatus Bathyarchaeota archaeon CG07_land_8_20_14_0_80_47_9]|nr:MAG: hypothetical protein COS86_06035 [Candidatus Bathyarchaeota archaeon CG07_land_8_20_14_0_80_47_9]
MLQSTQDYATRPSRRARTAYATTVSSHITGWADETDGKRAVTEKSNVSTNSATFSMLILLRSRDAISNSDVVVVFKSLFPRLESGWEFLP